VTLDRSGMTAPCVLINIPVKATLSRAATFESEEITWMLTALVLRDGITPEQITNIAKQCKSAGDVPTPPDNNKPANAGKCETGAEIFGFNRIGEIEGSKITKTLNSNYCEDKFCNNNMLYYYLENQYIKIDNAITAAEITCTTENEDRMISEIYKEAKTAKIKINSTDNNFYVGEGGDLVLLPYTISEKILTDKKVQVDEIKKGNARTDVAPISWMVEVLDKIPSSERKEVLIAISKIYLLNVKEDIGMTAVDDINYLPLDTYMAINTAIATNYDNCNTLPSCEIVLNGKTITLQASTMKAISENGSLVRGVIVGMESEEDKKAIYAANPKLEAVYKLAKENKDIYVTGIDEFVEPVEEFNKSFKIEHTTTFMKDDTTPGKYDYNIDTMYCADTTNRIMEIELAELEMEAKENKAKDNVILQNGFIVTEENIYRGLENTTSAILLEAKTDGMRLYERIPVQITVVATGGAKAIVYNPTQVGAASNNLITWNGAMNDTVQGRNFIVQLPSPMQPTPYNGIYYYPKDGSLSMTLDMGNGNVSARALILNTTTSAPQEIGNGKSATIQMGQLKQPTLSDVITLVQKQEKVCMSEDGQTINWKEAKLVK